MGPMCFDFGYGPFRWVCLSGKPEDLGRTDRAAMACIDPSRRGQDRDNYNWIRDAERNRLVVGTQARILYADAEGRVRIALEFNDMVREGRDRAGDHRAATTTTPGHRLAVPGDGQHLRRIEPRPPTWPTSASPATSPAA